MNSRNPHWDVYTRLIHWLIAIPVILNYFLETGDMPHKVVGYLSLFGLLLRALMGIWSQGTANFKNLPLKKEEVKKFLQFLFDRKFQAYPGHNPLASWTYIFIWLNVLFLGISGFMMGMDQFWGLDWPEDLHRFFSYTMQVLLFLHLLGLALDSIKYKRVSFLAMITGKK